MEKSRFTNIFSSLISSHKIAKIYRNILNMVIYKINKYYKIKILTTTKSDMK